MSGWNARSKRLLEIIEMTYAAADDSEMSLSLFSALYDLIPFSSGIFMPVNAETLELQNGLSFNCDPACMKTYLAHYAPQDPYVQREPSAELLNRTVRLSDVIPAAELERNEFSEFMRQVPYHDALANLTGMALQPVAVFSVHRQRHERRFCADDQWILDRIGPHLANAITLRKQMNDPGQEVETGILVFGATGRALYLNTAARRMLGTIPPQALLSALPAHGSSVISLASQCFRLSRMPWTAASLLQRFTMVETAAGPVDRVAANEDPMERWSVATRKRAGAVIALLQPFRQRIDLIRRLANYGLSPRQQEVAVWALRGLSNGEIARGIFISEQTVKEHCQEIYFRVGAKTRAEFLAKVLGSRGAGSSGVIGIAR